MATNRFLDRETELTLQTEVSYGTDPGAAAAGDFFKHLPAIDAIEHVQARVDRDGDADYNTASVISTQLARKSSNVQFKADVIPSGNAAAITAPDADLAYKNSFGNSHAGTAHTTTAAGSAGTAINFAVGGVAASGIAVKDIFAIDVSTAVGYEARQAAALPGGDVVTACRAFTTDPAAARVVKLGTTYKLDKTQLTSLYLKRYLGGTIIRDAVPGLILPQFEMAWDWGSGGSSPKLTASWKGKGKASVAHSDARPTPTTAGQALIPDKCYVWLGATKFNLAGSGSLTIDNGRDLSDKESGSLDPTRVYLPRRYMIQLSIGLMLTTGDTDVSAIETAIRAGTKQDVLIQFGTVAGTIVALRCPQWLPDMPKKGSIESEAALMLSGGRCYATSGDDEVHLAFI